MKKERSLSYLMSQKILDKDLSNISGAMTTITATLNGTYSPATGWDGTGDIVND